MRADLLEGIDAVAQALVPVVTVVSMWLLARRNRCGCVVGLVAQPLWATIYIVHGQRGPLVTVLLVTGSLLVGTYEAFSGRQRPLCGVCRAELREILTTDRLLHDRAQQCRAVAAGLLLATLLGVGGSVIESEDEERDNGAPRIPAVTAPSVVYVSLRPGVASADIAQRVGVEPVGVRVMSFGFHGFPVPAGLAVGELEARLRSTVGVRSATRDLTEEVVLS